ncbi:acyl-CoA dehydrogenase family protein [Brevibacterium luteolum]|uniref:Acyl-CoA/acyl-ACP dehydrogenase n=1 Tax=Brevibacterium luteolum TaxID=199591 RepID=A0A849AU50_9MICO|nr:acyl-CoA dehydrogenase family protein [Brevibacterium luteolum]MBM7528374.1 alkylation response protein AidB-like acyl-CoA dehydrogenase [Brevibacterium luteolum]NNG79420.1 acyl-CoA/acyl-ACP dehydrogenase [Brevibacterium luteolum]
MTIEMLETELAADLRRTVRAFLTERCDPGTVAEVYDDPAVASRELNDGWARELGLAGLLVPEADGGAGASLAEAAVVAHAIGRHAAPLRFLTSGVIATTLVTHAGDFELAAALAAGERYAAVAFPATSSTLTSGLEASDASGAEHAGTVHVSGTVAGVMEADGADDLIAVIGSGEDTTIVVIDPADARIAPFLSLDETRRLADVTVEGAAARVIATGPEAEAAATAATLAGQVALAAELAGTAAQAFSTTLDYVRTRVQFGRAIGSYQAIKHRLADLWLAVSQADAAATYAAQTAANWQHGGEDLHEAQICALTALAYTAPVAVQAAEEAVQLHGGNGMTWEYPVHLLLKRAKAGELILGHPANNRAALAELLELPTC